MNFELTFFFLFSCVSTEPLPAPPVVPTELNTALYINDYHVIRAKEDLFGRNITELRKGMTKGDTEPFATV